MKSLYHNHSISQKRECNPYIIKLLLNGKQRNQCLCCHTRRNRYTPKVSFLYNFVSPNALWLLEYPVYINFGFTNIYHASYIYLLRYQISMFLLVLIYLNLISKVCLLHHQKWLNIQVFNQLLYLVGLTTNLLTCIDDFSFSCPEIISSTHLFSISLLSYVTVSHEQRNRAL